MKFRIKSVCRDIIFEWEEFFNLSVFLEILISEFSTLIFLFFIMPYKIKFYKNSIFPIFCIALAVSRIKKIWENYNDLEVVVVNENEEFEDKDLEEDKKLINKIYFQEFWISVCKTIFSVFFIIINIVLLLVLFFL